MHKLVTVDSLGVYCDDVQQTDQSPSLPSCFLAEGGTDAELVGIFRTSMAPADHNGGPGQGRGALGKGQHEYVVMPVSPSFRLRVQKGDGDGGGGARCKVQAIFNEVGGDRGSER